MRARTPEELRRKKQTTPLPLAVNQTAGRDADRETEKEA
jgi:hypothetical protein